MTVPLSRLAKVTIGAAPPMFAECVLTVERDVKTVGLSGPMPSSVERWSVRIRTSDLEPINQRLDGLRVLVQYESGDCVEGAGFIRRMDFDGAALDVEIMFTEMPTRRTETDGEKLRRLVEEIRCRKS